MATRTFQAPLGKQPPIPPSDDIKSTVAKGSPAEPTTAPASAPVDSTPLASAGVAPESAKVKEVDTDATAPAEKEEPKIIAIVARELSVMIEKLQGNLDSLKEQKAETPDHLSLMKLSCAKVLREAVQKVAEMEETVAKMRQLHDATRTQQKNFDEAIANNRRRSEAFRTERAAFIKLRSLSEKEYYALVNEVMARTKAEKEAK